jgi:hypothetical protein
VLLIIGSLLPIASSFTYIVSILRGKSRPQRMTRLLLVIITALATLSLWANGDSSGVWLALASFLEAVAIWVLSLKRGVGGAGRLDIVCFVLCIVGVAFWLISGHSLVGLFASIVADLIACIPSLHKTIRMPHTESFWFYLLGAVAGLSIVLAGPLTWEAVIFPAYILLIDLSFAVVIGRGKYRGRSGALPTPMG